MLILISDALTFVPSKFKCNLLVRINLMKSKLKILPIKKIDFFSERTRSSTLGGTSLPELVQYPDNLNLKDIYYFW